jgi:hypothetical protein
VNVYPTFFARLDILLQKTIDAHSTANSKKFYKALEYGRRLEFWVRKCVCVCVGGGGGVVTSDLYHEGGPYCLFCRELFRCGLLAISAVSTKYMYSKHRHHSNRA